MEKIKRAVIHVDLDAFFASVEIKKRPGLRGRAVVVGADGDPAKRGVVSAASYEARAFGVRSGMPLKRAHRLCPDAVFLPVDFEAYEKESERFMAILADYSLAVESFGLDEAFLEFRGIDALKEAVRTAEEIRRRIKKELKLTASAGVGPNKLLAKMATGMKKPDGFFVIREEDVEALFREMPVRSLYGVGPKTEQKLKSSGIHTIGELARAPELFLMRNFGPNIGRTLHEHALGRDDSPVVAFYEPESLGREVTFEEDTFDAYIIKETLYALTEDVTARLKSIGKKCRTVAIKIRYGDFKTITRETTFPEATDSMNDIWKGALKLLESVEPARAIRLVGVKTAHLTGLKAG